MNTQAKHSRTPFGALFAPIRCLFAYRELVFQLTRRRIVLRYRGSIIGATWMVLAPALMLAVYTLVFGVIFEPRWTTTSGNTSEYAMLLYLGLCAYWFLSDCVAEAPSQIMQHANYVKKVVFPLDILAWVSVCTALFHSSIRLLVFAIACMAIEGRVPVTILLLPIVWIPLTLLTLGFSWALSAIGVFVRDLVEVVTLALTAILFLSPVFYSVESVPPAFRWLLLINPLTAPIGQIRDVAYFGVMPEVGSMLTTLTASYAVAWLGHALFLRTRRGFADAL